MKLLFTPFFLLLFCISPSHASSWEWAKSMAGTNGDFGNSIAVDANGNSYVTGSFSSDTLKLDSLTYITTSTLFPITTQQIFLAKYDAVGNMIWAKGSQSSFISEGLDVAVAADGSVYVTGYFYCDTLRFDSITLVNSSSGINADIFIVKYSNTGNVLWAKSAGGAIDDIATSIAVASDGSVFVTGCFRSSTLTFNNGTNLVKVGVSNIFLAKYDYSGNLLWAKKGSGDCGSQTFLSISNQYSLALDASDNIYIAGCFFSPTFDFDGTLISNAFSNNTSDNYMAKYDSQGNVLWAKSQGLFGNNLFADIAVEASGAYHILAGGGVLTKYDVSGNLISTLLLSYSSFGICVDLSGNLYSGSNRFSKYDNLGNETILDSLVSTSSWSNDIATDNNGNVFSTGEFLSPTYIGNYYFVPIGAANVYVAKLSTTLSVNENPRDPTTIRVYPNPNRGEINISSKEYISNITITNLLGQIIYQARPNERDIFLHLELEGIYFVSITTKNKVLTQKIVVDSN